MDECWEAIITGLRWVGENAAVPFGAAFAGAWFAFRNGRKLQAEAADKQDHISAHRMLLVLTQQYQILLNLEQTLAKEKNKSDENKSQIIAKLNDVKLNINDFSFKGAHASTALPGLMIAERAYLQAIDALECYNQAHAKHVDALLEQAKGTIVADFSYACEQVKGGIFGELMKEIEKAKPKLAFAYKEFRMNLTERWNKWELPSDIDSLAKNYEDIFGGNLNDQRDT